MGYIPAKHVSKSALPQPIWKKVAVGLSTVALAVTGLFAVQSITAPKAIAGSKLSIGSKEINGYDKTFFINDGRDIADSDIGDGICATKEDLLGQKSCTLYAAIQEANKWTKDNPGKSVLITPADLIRDTRSGNMQETAEIFLNWGNSGNGEWYGDKTMQKAQNPYNVLPMVDGKKKLNEVAGTVKGAKNENLGATYLLEGSNITVDLQDRLKTTTDDDGPTRVTFLLNGKNIKLRNASKVTAGGVPIMVGQNAKNCLLENITLNNDKVGGDTSPAETGIVIAGGASGTTFSNINIRNMYTSSINFVKNDFAPSKTIDNTTIDKMYIRSNEDGFKWDNAAYKAVTLTGGVTLNGLTIKNSLAHNMSSTDYAASGYRAGIWLEDGTVNDLNIVNNRFLVDDVPASWPPNPLSIMLKAGGSNWNISDNTFDWTYPGTHEGTGWDTWESWINVRPSSKIDRVKIMRNKINGLIGTGPAFSIRRENIDKLTMRLNTFINVGGNSGSENPIDKGSDFEVNPGVNNLIWTVRPILGLLHSNADKNIHTVYPTKIKQGEGTLAVTVKKPDSYSKGIAPKYPITVDFYTGTSTEPGYKGNAWKNAGKFAQTYIGTVTINSEAELGSDGKEFIFNYAGDMTNHRHVRVQTTDATGNSSLLSRASKEDPEAKKAKPQIWIKRMGYTAGGDESFAQPKTTYRRFMNFEIYTSVPTDPATIRKNIKFVKTGGNPKIVPNTEEYSKRGVNGFITQGENLVSNTAQQYSFAVQCDDSCEVTPYVPAGVFKQADDEHAVETNLKSNSTKPPANFVGEVDGVNQENMNTVTFNNPLISSSVQEEVAVAEGDIKNDELTAGYLTIAIRNRYQDGESSGQVVYTPIKPLELNIVPINSKGEMDMEAEVVPSPVVNKLVPVQKAKDVLVMRGKSLESGWDEVPTMRTYTREYQLGLEAIDNTVVDGTRTARYALEVKSGDIEFRGLKLLPTANGESRSARDGKEEQSPSLASGLSAPINVTILDNDNPASVDEVKTLINKQKADGQNRDMVIFKVYNGGTKERVKDQVWNGPTGDNRPDTSTDEGKKEWEKYREEHSSINTVKKQLVSNAHVKVTLPDLNKDPVTGNPVADADKTTERMYAVDCTTGAKITDSEGNEIKPGGVFEVITDKNGEAYFCLTSTKAVDNYPVKAEVEKYDQVKKENKTKDKVSEEKVAFEPKVTFLPLPIDNTDNQGKASKYTVTSGEKKAGLENHKVTVTLKSTEKDGEGNPKPVTGAADKIVATLSGLPEASIGSFTEEKDAEGNPTGVYTANISSTAKGAVTVDIKVKQYDPEAADDAAPAQLSIPNYPANTKTAKFVEATKPVDTGKSEYTVTAGEKEANGSAAHTLTIQLKDAEGNPTAGQVVVTSSGTGPTFGDPTKGTKVDATTFTSDANGKLVIPVTSKTAGTFTITPKVGGKALTNKPENTNTAKFVAGKPATGEGLSSVSITPGWKASDNKGTHTITVVLKDANGNPISGKTDIADFGLNTNVPPGVSYGKVTMVEAGKYQIPVTSSKDVNNVPQTITVDTVEIGTVNLKFKKTGTPNVNHANKTGVDGTAPDTKKGSTVDVTYEGEGGKECKTQGTTTDENGNFSVNWDPNCPPKNGGKVEVKVTDKDTGVQSDAGTSTIDLDTPPTPTINETNGTKAKGISGTATNEPGKTLKPGSTIRVTIGDGTPIEGITIGKDGNWSVPADKLPADIPAGTTIKAEVVAPSGNASDPAATTKVDKDKPAKPVLEGPSNGKEVKGKVTKDSEGKTPEPGATVVVSYTGTDGKPHTKEGTTNEKGEFTVTLDNPAAQDGSQITAVATDKAGNPSEASDPITVDGSQPAPSVDPVGKDLKVTGKAMDKTGDDAKPEKDAKVIVYGNDGKTQIGEGKTKDDGTFEIKLDEGKVKHGDTIYVTVEDGLGNVSPKTSAPVDLVSPDAPVVNQTNGETVSGTATHSGDGKASTVDVTVTPKGGKPVTIKDVPVGADGKWSIPNDKLKEAMGVTDDNYKLPAGTVISATAKDAAGNVSDKPGTATVDGNASLTVTNPLVKPGTDAAPTPFTGSVDKAEKINPADKTPTKSQVKLYKKEGTGYTEVPSTAKVNDDGTFTLTPNTKLADGDYYIQAKDPVGNLSQPVKVTVDGTAPALNLPNNNDGKTLNGTAEEGAEAAVVKINNQVVDKCKTTVGSGGVFTIEFGKNGCPEVNNGDVVTVTVTDKAGNETTGTSTVDKTQPQVTMNNVDGTVAAPKLSGTAEPGATVTIKAEGSTEITTATATNCGEATCPWEVDMPASWKTLTDKTKLTATVTKNVGGVDKTGTANAVLRTKAMAETTVEKSNGKVISGTAEPGASVQLWDKEGKTKMGEAVTADGTGHWTVTLPDGTAYPDGTGVVKAVASDGLRQDKVGYGDVDATAPNLTVPAVNNGKTINITGVSDDASKIIVTRCNADKTKCDEVIPGTTTNDGKGNWTWTADDPSKLKEGDTIKVAAEDGVGNTSPGQESQVDKTPPTIEKVTAGTDENAPAITSTNGNDPLIVKTDQKNAKVTVTYQTETGPETITETADENGKVTINFPADKKPKHGSTVSIDAEDGVSNSTADANPAGTKKLTVDTKKPADPTVVLDKNKKKEVSGKVPTDQTDKPLDPGTKVTVCVTKKGAAKPVCKTGDVGNDGSYTVPLDQDLADGDVVTVVATDPAGNKSNETTKKVDFSKPNPPSIVTKAGSPKEVSGNAEPGSTVKVCVGTACKEATADKTTGDYTVTMDNPLKTGDVVKATAKDEAGNVSDEATKTVDFTAPGTPTDVHANGDGVTGEVPNCKPNGVGDKVIVKDKDGKAIGEGTVGDDCKFNVKYYDGVKPNNGDKIKVEIVDKDDPTNKSGEAETTVDTVAPSAPVIRSTTGNANDPVTVEVTDPEGTLTVTYVDVAGNKQTLTFTGPWQEDTTKPGVYLATVFLPTAAPEGKGVISATHTDPAGNTSEAGYGDVDRSTDVPQVDKGRGDRFTGKAEAGAEVVINYTGIDGKPQTAKAIADKDGNFDTGKLDVPAAQGIYPAVATDKQGNTTDKEGKPATGSAVVIRGDIPVSVEPTNGKTVKGNVDPSKKGDLKQVEITYTDINGDQTVVPVSLDSIDDNGNFEIILNPAAKDGTTVTVTAKDNFDNEGSVSETVDAVAPKAPTVDKATEKQISGKTDPSEAGGTVKVKDKDGKVIGTGTVQPDGTFTVTYDEGKEPKDGDKVTVTVTDKAGNESEGADVTVDGSSHLTDPQISPDGKTVTGKADPGSTVEVKDEDGKVIGSAVTDEEGNFKVDLDRQLKPGEKVTVTATDKDNHQDTQTVTYDPVIPSQPTIDGTGADGTVTGTGDPGSIITVCVNGNARCETTSVGADGKFTVKIPGGLKAGDSVKVWATDPVSGVSSKVVYYTLKFEGSGSGDGSGSVAGHGKLKPALAKTGADLSLLIPLMMMLLLSGAGALVLARRRTDSIRPRHLR